jgi:hypothetical protein
VGQNRRAARVRCGAGERAQMQESGRGGVAGEAERGARKKGEGERCAARWGRPVRERERETGR